MIIDGPVSMTVRIESQVDSTNRMVFETEFVVSGGEEASEKGEQFTRLIKAFSAGFSEAA